MLAPGGPGRGRGAHADDFVVAEDPAERYYDGIEIPDPEERPLTVIP